MKSLILIQSLILVGFAANLSESSSKMKHTFGIDKQIIDIARQIEQNNHQLDDGQFINLLEDVKADLSDKKINDRQDTVSYDLKDKINKFIQYKLNDLRPLGISKKTIDTISDNLHNQINKLELVSNKYIPISKGKRFLLGLDKRHAPKIPNNDILSFSTLIEPISQKENIDKRSNQLNFADDTPSNAETIVPNSVLMKLISTYRRFMKTDEIYNDNKMSPKNF